MWETRCKHLKDSYATLEENTHSPAVTRIQASRIKHEHSDNWATVLESICEKNP